MKPIWHTKFSDWPGPELIASWGLVLDRSIPDFKAWIDAPLPLLDSGREQMLEHFRTELELLHTAWNETELLAHFIAPVISLVGFRGADYNFFFERKLTARFEQGRLSGTVDGMVARGLSNPREPYFFLHEYKKTKGSEADPQGQLLVAMLTAQHLNPESDPLYGCYIVGRIWTFVYLTGRTFAESQGYDASDPGELRTVLAILHETKRRIEARVAAAG